MYEGNGADGKQQESVTKRTVSVVRVLFDHETCLVSLDAGDMLLGLTQMILGEAQRQLEEQRRAGVALQIREQLLQAQQNAAIAASLRGR
jgi:hypothetical protein